METAERQFFKLGLIGYPVAHSLSPILHSRALAYCGLQGSYQLIALEPPLKETEFRLLFEQGYNGLNVTIPHKQAVIPFLDNLTAEAEQVKAVNTIRLQGDGMLVGHNTDLDGFAQTLDAELIQNGWFEKGQPRSLLQCTACVIGAGGAARAALWGLVKLGFGTIFVLARRIEQAQVLAAEFTSFASKMTNAANFPQVQSISPEDKLSAYDFDLIVNAAPIGLSGSELPDWLMHLLGVLCVKVKASRRRRVVYDMVYDRKGSTPLVEQAKLLGIAASDGLPMLAQQAALAFEFWTGRQIPTIVMMQALQTN